MNSIDIVVNGMRLSASDASDASTYRFREWDGNQRLFEPSVVSTLAMFTLIAALMEKRDGK